MGRSSLSLIVIVTGCFFLAAGQSATQPTSQPSTTQSADVEAAISLPEHLEQPIIAKQGVGASLEINVELTNHTDETITVTRPIQVLIPNQRGGTHHRNRGYSVKIVLKSPNPLIGVSFDFRGPLRKLEIPSSQSRSVAVDLSPIHIVEGSWTIQAVVSHDDQPLFLSNTLIIQVK